jgi:hypothetical protein
MSQSSLTKLNGMYDLRPRRIAISDLIEPQDRSGPVTGVGKGSAFVLKNKRRCLGIWRTGKGPLDVFELPIVHVKHNHPHVLISGLLGESIEGRQIEIAPTGGTDYEDMLPGIRSEFLTRL